MSNTSRSAIRNLKSALAAIDAADDFYNRNVRRHSELHMNCIGRPGWLVALGVEHNRMVDTAKQQFVAALDAAVEAGCRISRLRELVGDLDRRFITYSLVSAETERLMAGR